MSIKGSKAEGEERAGDIKNDEENVSFLESGNKCRSQTKRPPCCLLVFSSLESLARHNPGQPDVLTAMYSAACNRRNLVRTWLVQILQRLHANFPTRGRLQAIFTWVCRARISCISLQRKASEEKARNTAYLATNKRTNSQ